MYRFPNSPEENAAWNAQANQATFDDSVNSAMQRGRPPVGFGGYLLPAAGAFGLYDVYKNKGGTSGGALQGALSGAAIGGSFGGVPGALIGGALGGISSLFGGKSRTKIEEQRREKLAEMGINLGDQKAWELNEAFNKSRNEADLKGSDIVGAANLYDIFGARWGGLDPSLKTQIADEALKRGLVREHHGTIDINANPEFLSYASSAIQGATKPKSSGGGARRPESRPKEKKPKGDPNIALVDIMPVFKPPPPQAEPDSGEEYQRRIREYISNGAGY